MFVDLLLLNIFDDFNFILKIFFFLFIISFVRQKITHNVFALILISIAVIALIFVYWPLFGGLYFIYVLITIGISSVVVDFFFVSMGGEGPKEMLDGNSDGHKGVEAMKRKDAVHTGIEMQQRQQSMQQLKKMRPF